MDLGLKDKVAIVGGASKGLGRACAEVLAEEGVKVAVCSRTAAELERAAQEIRDKTGTDVLVIIIVGGVAATIHGSARLTQDLDIVYARPRTSSGSPPRSSHTAHTCAGHRLGCPSDGTPRRSGSSWRGWALPSPPS